MLIEDLTGATVFLCFFFAILVYFYKPKRCDFTLALSLPWWAVLPGFLVAPVMVVLPLILSNFTPFDMAYYVDHAVGFAGCYTPSSILTGYAVTLAILRAFSLLAGSFFVGYWVYCAFLIFFTGLATWVFARVFSPSSSSFAGVLALFSPTVLVAVWAGLLAQWLAYGLTLLALACFIHATSFNPPRYVPDQTWYWTASSRAFMFLLGFWGLVAATLLVHKWAGGLLLLILIAYLLVKRTLPVFIAVASILVPVGLAIALYSNIIEGAMVKTALLEPSLFKPGSSLILLGGPIAVPWLFLLGVIGLAVCRNRLLAGWMVGIGPMMVMDSFNLWRFFAFYPWPVLLVFATGWFEGVLGTRRVRWVVLVMCVCYVFSWVFRMVLG